MACSNLKQTRIQLKDSVTGAVIQTAGGVVAVCAAGTPDKLALVDSTGAAASNPSPLTNGLMEFYVAETVQSFDLFLLAPGGQFVSVYGVVPGGPNEIAIDTNDRNQTMVIPFSHVDSTAATEQDTGFDEPASCIFTGIGTGIRVVDIDATETIDVGTATADSGDPNGFVAAASVATAGVVVSAGALIISTADYQPHIGAGKSITYTTTAGSDTVSGFAILPYVLTV